MGAGSYPSRHCFVDLSAATCVAIVSAKSSSPRFTHVSTHLAFATFLGLEGHVSQNRAKPGVCERGPRGPAFASEFEETTK